MDKKMWYAIEYYSAIKSKEIMSFAATWMDLEIAILIEVSQTEKIKYHMIIVHMSYCLYVELKKNGANELIYKTEIGSQM